MNYRDALALEAYPVNYNGEVGRFNPDRNAPLRQAFRKGWDAYQARLEELSVALSELDLDAALDSFIYGRFKAWKRDDENKYVMVVFPDGSQGPVKDWKITASEVSPDTMREIAAYFFALFITTIQETADELEGAQ